MRFRLRTLMIVLALGPPLMAGLFFYPTVFVFIGGLVAISCLGAAIGGVFGKVLEGGILAFALLFLLALFLPATMGSRPSPTAATSITVHFFNEAIESYKNKVGELPPDLESLLKPPPNLPNDTDWGGPYLSYEKMPVDPWHGKFQYEVLDAENGKFRVWSKGPDRRSHTEDDIYGW
jgi:membrane protein implicated in regulation of membrane protease activity